MTKEEMIDRLWGQSNHGTQREDIEAAYNAGAAAEREACAAICDDEANRMEESAQRAIENGEHDEVSAIRSTAWKLSVAAARIRKRGAA